jgi:multicomponent Na+:H+ antiporter subunit E
MLSAQLLGTTGVAVPRMSVEPRYLRLPLRIGAEAGRLWLVASVSLMPGTLSYRLEEDSILVHVLDRRMAVEGTFRRAEELIEAIFEHKGQR